MNSYSPPKRNKGMLTWMMAACVCGMLASVSARAAGTNRLEAVDVQPLAGQQLQITLRLSNPAPEPVSFTIDNPARISLDLPDTSLALPSRRIDVRSAGLDTILAAEAGDRTRIVLNLDRLLPYTTRTQGNDIIVMLGVDDNGQQAAPVARSGVAAAGQERLANNIRGIRSIDFRRGADGTGRVIVKLTDPRTPINLRRVGNQIVVDFSGAELPANLMRRYDATDFGTPVMNFDVQRAGNNTRLVVNANGEFEQLAYQTDDQYVVEVQPIRQTAAAREQKREYTGPRISLQFQDIETRAVLQILADELDRNIVVTDTVTGNVTLSLQNVPADQAMDIVMRTKGLDKREEGNVILVAPAEELAAREKAALAAKNDIQELAPLRSEYLQVNYAKAADMAQLIKSQGGGSLLSPRGTVTVDERTNTLLLQDTPERLDEIRRLVTTLDIPMRQVLIEARIVVVNDDFRRDLGVRAGYTGIRRNGNDGAIVTSGSAEATDTALGSALDNLQNNGTPFPIGIPTGPGVGPSRYNVNLPVQNAAGKLAFLVLGSDYIVDLELSAAESEGRGQIISSPHVITANQKEASIEQGVEIPYQEAASSGATTISFKKAVLSLRVTPQITPDNRIILDLNVKKDNVGTIFVTSGGVNVPSIDTREINASVMVSDGQTVVLGGILETEQRETETKVPLLGDVPVLGRLFKSTSRTDNKDELLIFVTPKILREGVNVY